MNIRLNQPIIFVITFLSYALLHANRKSFSNVKPTLEELFSAAPHNATLPLKHPAELWTRNRLFSSAASAKVYLGVLDTVFMAAYGVGLYVCGVLGDRINPRLVLAAGMMLTSVDIFVFGVVTEWTHCYNVYLYAVLYAMNGLFQSAGWPTSVAIMANWFDHGRGTIFGVWSACASVGNILGDMIDAAVLDWGYEYGFLVPASMLLSGGLLVLCSVISHPDEIVAAHERRIAKIHTRVEPGDHGDNDIIKSVNEPSSYYTSTERILPADDDDDYEEDRESGGSMQATSKSSSANTTTGIGFFRAILLPGVAAYALAYAFLKLVNYSFFFWLVDYLTHNFGWTNALADKMSIWYDVGGIVGGIGLGLVSDLMWSRSPVTVLSLLLAIPALFFYSLVGGTPWKNALFMGVIGGLIGGPASIISSAISADLGRQECLAGDVEAMSTVTGIVDGTGSVGVAVGQVLIPYLSNISWDLVFYLFMGLDALTIVCISPILYKDVKRRWNQRRDYALLRASNSMPTI